MMLARLPWLTWIQTTGSNDSISTILSIFHYGVGDAFAHDSYPYYGADETSGTICATCCFILSNEDLCAKNPDLLLEI